MIQQLLMDTTDGKACPVAGTVYLAAYVANAGKRSFKRLIRIGERCIYYN